MVYLLKMVIFYSYVKLPEGILSPKVAFLQIFLYHEKNLSRFMAAKNNDYFKPTPGAKCEGNFEWDDC